MRTAALNPDDGQAGSRNQPYPADTHDSLAALAEEFWLFQCRESPLTAMQAGLPVDTDEISFEGVSDHVRRAETATTMLSRLALIDRDGLGPKDSVTHDLLERELEHLVRTVQTGAYLRPSLFPFGADMMALRLGSVSTIASVADADVYLARLGAIPRSIGVFVATIRHGVVNGVSYPRVVVERAVAQARALRGLPLDVHPLLDPFRRSDVAQELLAPAKRLAESQIASDVAEAISAYADAIARDLAPVARELAADDAGGAEDRYRLAIAFYGTVDDAPDAIHRLGLSEVERVNGEIEALAKEAGLADSGQLRRAAIDATTQVSASALLLRERIELLARRIDAKVPDWIGRLPRTGYVVRSIPERMSAGLPPAYAQPNPADGSAPGTLWITSMPDKLPAYLQVATTLHEGWPGHLLHVALIQEQESLPAFQRYNAIRYSACLEGWALYCEWLGESAGLYDTPLERFGRLDMEMWRACRLVVDTGLHTQGWTRARAVSFMQERLALPLATIEAEVDRYAGWAGQALSYQLGNIAFRALRREAEARLAGRFDVRAFHDCLMRAGPVTLPILETIVRSWIGDACAANDGQPDTGKSDPAVPTPR